MNLKKIKKFLSYLFGILFTHALSSVFFIILGFLLFYIGYYILAAYMFVGSAFLIVGLDKFKFDKQQLKVEHHKIDYEVLPDSFELKTYHIIFIIITLSIAVFFNVFIGMFYLMFILFGVLGGFFKWNVYNTIPDRFYLYSKNCKKDFKTISYHWSSDFLFFKILNRLTLISLPLGVIVLVFALPFHKDHDPIIALNLYQASFIFCLHVVCSFMIDVYIIFFCNTSVLNKYGVFCYRCALYGAAAGGVGNVVEQQLIHNGFDRLGFQWKPTGFTNVPRAMVGRPILLDNDQYWHEHIINKYLPDVTPEQYCHKRDNITSQIDSSKTTEILRKNWPTLSQNCTKQELARLRLGEGYMKGYGPVVRK